MKKFFALLVAVVLMVACCPFALCESQQEESVTPKEKYAKEWFDKTFGTLGLDFTMSFKEDEYFITITVNSTSKNLSTLALLQDETWDAYKSAFLALIVEYGNAMKTNFGKDTNVLLYLQSIGNKSICGYLAKSYKTLDGKIVDVKPETIPDENSYSSVFIDEGVNTDIVKIIRDSFPYIKNTLVVYNAETGRYGLMAYDKTIAQIADDTMRLNGVADTAYDNFIGNIEESLDMCLAEIAKITDEEVFINIALEKEGTGVELEKYLEIVKGTNSELFVLTNDVTGATSDRYPITER